MWYSWFKKRKIVGCKNPKFRNKSVKVLQIRTYKWPCHSYETEKVLHVFELSIESREPSIDQQPVSATKSKIKTRFKTTRHSCVFIQCNKLARHRLVTPGCAGGTATLMRIHRGRPGSVRRPGGWERDQVRVLVRVDRWLVGPRLVHSAFPHSPRGGNMGNRNTFPIPLGEWI